jgi:hypothetical protein
MLNMPWPHDKGADMSQAANHMLPAECFFQLIGWLNAIAEPDREGPPADQWPHLLDGFRDAPSLGTYEDYIHRADLCRVVCGFGGLNDKIARDAVNTQAVLLNGFEMLATRNEGDVLSGLRKFSPEVSADTARPKDYELHNQPLTTRNNQSFDLRFISPYPALLQDA